MIRLDPDHHYTPSELEEIADEILRDDRRATGQFHNILLPPDFRYRRRREIYTAEPDPTLTASMSPDGQRMYWRSHPQGLPLSKPEAKAERKAGFYAQRGRIRDR